MILKDITFIDNDFSVKRGNLWVNEEKREWLSANDFSNEEILNCSGLIAVPGFVNGHHHAYSCLSRGMGAPAKSPENFFEVLKYIWWTLDKCLDAEMIRASALAVASDCAKKGVTAVIDHHASPFAIEGSLQIIAKAFDEVGVSSLLCYEISDRDGKEIAEKGLSETESFLKSGGQGLVGLHASFTVQDSTLEKAVDLAKKYDSGIHVHTAEAESDQTETIQMHGMRVAERYEKFGAMDFSKSIFAHCLHLTDRERAKLAYSPAWIVQNAESNLNNAVGMFDSRGLGEELMLGTDGMHSDMIRSAQASFLVGQFVEAASYSDLYDRFLGAGRYLRENKFRGAGENNLTILDYRTPTEITSDNFLAHFYFGFDSSQVVHTISEGKLIVKNRELQTVNESEILNFSREQGKRLWEKMSRFQYN